jgi:hypothetical protein
MQAESAPTIPPPYLFERETEILGFTPLSFVDAIINAVNQMAHSSMESLQELVDEEIGQVDDVTLMENEMVRLIILLYVKKLV